MVDAPILHVNGDDPETCLLAIELALDYRQKFHKDVFIDLVCFRRYGHNEADEPMVTQPLMYKKISQHSGTRRKYAEQLAAAAWSRWTRPRRWSPITGRRWTRAGAPI